MRRFLRMGAAVATLCCGRGAWAQTDPKPLNMGSWFNMDDYPPDALKKGEIGWVAYEVEVDPTGKPIGCRTTDTSNSASLDKVTCDLAMARGSFQPATDATGSRIAGKSRLRIRWTLPSVTISRNSVRSFALIEHLTFDGEGKVIDCKGRTVGEIGGELPVCLRVGETLIAGVLFDKRNRNGVATRTVTQHVEGDPIPPGAPSDDVPPNWVVDRSFTLQPDGRVADCSQRESGKGLVACETPAGYAPPTDGQPHRVTFETRWSFQP